MKPRHGVIALVAAAAIAAPLLFVMAGPAVTAQGAGNVCVADTDSLGNVAGYSGEQLEHAATIITASTEFDVGLRGAQIGVMTAMEESTLQNLDYGDNARNPDGSIADSLGLFQQQGHWGTVEQRMNPIEASRLFYDALVQVNGWETLAPHEAAYAVQINDGAWRYAEHWEEAVEVVTALTTGEDCSTSGTLTADGWSKPTAGDPITSGYGWRWGKFHYGVDFAPADASCGAPIFSVASGYVETVRTDLYGAWVIEIQHGGGYETWYVHMETDGVLVEEGQIVEGGQLIGLQGNSGYSFGCHLHFEARFEGENIDPIAWLESHGVTLP